MRSGLAHADQRASWRAVSRIPLDVSRRRQRTDRRPPALTLDPHPEVRDTPPQGEFARSEFLSATAKALQLMRTLFAIEHRLKHASPEARLAVRQAQSQPVIETLRAWLDATRPSVTPKSKLGQALAYLDGQWPRLVVFLEHGAVEMTNNAAENAFRPFCVGRRNWLCVPRRRYSMKGI